jgi:CRP/FNR family cyclic AMP-dependent transcriptional regulator
MMPVANNFHIIDDCLHCAFRENRLFCDLPNDALQRLQQIKATAIYLKGTMLCLEGQGARGVYVLCTGRAKLSTTSAEGRSIILRIAEPGEVLGLTASLSNAPYEATVETLEPSQANFISQDDFTRFLQQYPEVGVKVAQQLTHNCQCAYKEIRSIGLSNSVPERIAKLLLNWCERPLHLPEKKKASEIALRVTFTQEEIAQLAGTSRETVSRVLSDFKKKGWLRIKGATWFVLDKAALQKLVTI